MDIKECYKKINGDYEDVLSRLLKEERVEKFLLKLLEKNDMVDLKVAIDKEDFEKAFIIAHTMKGMSLNLGLTTFTDKISKLTELLRPRKVDNKVLLNELYTQSNEEFNKICEIIKDYQ